MIVSFAYFIFTYSQVIKEAKETKTTITKDGFSLETKKLIQNISIGFKEVSRIRSEMQNNLPKSKLIKQDYKSDAKTQKDIVDTSQEALKSLIQQSSLLEKQKAQLKELELNIHKLNEQLN